MEIKSLQAKDICNIIKTCRESGVQSLELGQLKVSFGKTAGMHPEMPGMDTIMPPPESGTTPPPVKKLELSEADKELIQELEDNQRMLEDPAGWEQSIIDRHILGEVTHEDTERDRIK